MSVSLRNTGRCLKGKKEVKKGTTPTETLKIKRRVQIYSSIVGCQVSNATPGNMLREGELSSFASLASPALMGTPQEQRRHAFFVNVNK